MQSAYVVHMSWFKYCGQIKYVRYDEYDVEYDDDGKYRGERVG